MTSDPHPADIKIPDLSALASEREPVRRWRDIAAFILALSALIAISTLSVAFLGERSASHDAKKAAEAADARVEELTRQNACRSRLSTAIDVAEATYFIAVIDSQLGQPIDVDLPALRAELVSARDDRANASALCGP